MAGEPQHPQTGPILSNTEARKRFFLFLVLKLGGLGALFAGVMLSRSGITITSGLLFAIGAISLFLRPRMLGLTTRPER